MSGDGPEFSELDPLVAMSGRRLVDGAEVTIYPSPGFNWRTVSWVLTKDAEPRQCGVCGAALLDDPAQELATLALRLGPFQCEICPACHAKHFLVVPRDAPRN